MNQDGYADFLIGADQYEVDGVAQAGRVYLYYGSATVPGAEADWTAAGTQTNGRFGHDVGLAGDVNGDGLLELIIGDLTIRDATRPVIIAVTTILIFPNRLEGSAATTINRADFGLIFTNASGMANVDELVLLEMGFVARADSR